MWNHSDSKTHIIQPMNSLYKSFLTRINLTVWIILVIVLIIALQNTLAEEIKIGAVIPRDIRGALELTLTNQIWLGIKVLVLVPIIVFWLLDRRRWLRLALLISLGLLTLELLSSVSFLVVSLTSDTSRNAVGLVRDTIIVALINILIFSLWYWMIDAYPLQPRPFSQPPNDFLFPQYNITTPQFAKWQPQYVDYLFLAFTTTTAFGPTDTLPLTHRAKMLMMLQALLSLLIIVVLAGRALSILR
jgi:hypothetical protein